MLRGTKCFGVRSAAALLDRSGATPAIIAHSSARHLQDSVIRLLGILKAALRARTPKDAAHPRRRGNGAGTELSRGQLLSGLAFLL